MMSKMKRELTDEGGGEPLHSRFKVEASALSEGRYTAVSDRQMLEFIFIDLETVLERASRLLSPYDMHMALFHIDLLKREFLKQPVEGEPSANIMMMSGTWLQTRVTGLAPSLARLWLSSAAAKTISRAGYSMEFWVNARISNYEVDGGWFNLKLLKDALRRLATEDWLLAWCNELGIAYSDLYGSTEADKAQELLALSVRYGRVRKINALLQNNKLNVVA